MQEPDKLLSGTSTAYKVMSLSQKEACYCCGLTNHKANDCRFKEAICHSCGEKDIKNGCVKVANNLQRRGKSVPTHKRTKWVITDQSSENSVESVEVHMARKQSTQPIRVEVQINSKPLSMKQVLLCSPNKYFRGRTCLWRSAGECPLWGADNKEASSPCMSLNWMDHASCVESG